MTFPFSTFYSQAGKAFHAGDTLNTALVSDVHAEAEDFTQSFGSSSLEAQEAVKDATSAMSPLLNAGRSFNQSLIYTPLRNLLVQLVKEDNPQPDDRISTAIEELIRQMKSESETLNASTPGASVSYGGGNVGDGKFFVSTKRGDGLVNEHILAEDIEASVTTLSSNGEAMWRLRGESSVDRMSPEWPKGSGASSSVVSHVGASAGNLVTGTFETSDPNAESLPSGWICAVGTLGTTVKLTPVEVQTVVISGDPGDGGYVLSFTDRYGKVQTTSVLVYNSSSAAVQSALRALVGLESVTVVQSGVSPNYTHTISLVGVPNPGQLTSSNTFDQGSIAHSTTVAGSAHVVRAARSLELDSDGSELTTLYHRVALSPASCYRFHSWMLADVVPAAGVVTVDLVDGIGGTVIQDDQGVDNSFTVDCTSLATSFGSRGGAFRSPTVMPSSVYLRLRISTAVSSGTSLYLDEVCFVPETEIYAGGPFVSAFTGPAAWRSDDTVALAMTNDRAGAVNEWMGRVFGLADSRYLLPTDDSGSETISDTVIG